MEVAAVVSGESRSAVVVVQIKKFLVYMPLFGNENAKLVLSQGKLQKVSPRTCRQDTCVVCHAPAIHHRPATSLPVAPPPPCSTVPLKCSVERTYVRLTNDLSLITFWLHGWLDWVAALKRIPFPINFYD